MRTPFSAVLPQRGKGLVLFLSFFILTTPLLKAQEWLQTIQILGVITSKSGSGVALLKNRQTGEIKAVKEGKPVFTAGTLVAVAPSVIIVKDKSGRYARISSKLGGSLHSMGPRRLATSAEGQDVSGEFYSEDGFQRQGNKVTVDARYRDRMIKEELPKILMQASSEPVMDGGNIRGFRLFQFDKGSIYEKVGMKDGDVVTEINGVPLNNVAKTVQFLNSLRTENNVKISVVRNGQPVTLDLNVN